MPIHRNDHRSAPRADPFGLPLVPGFAAGFLDLPDVLARRLVECDQKRSLARAEVQDDEITVKQRRRSIPPDVMAFAQVAAPELVAVEIVTDEPRRTVGCDHTLSVRYRRRGAIGIRFVSRFFLLVLHV